MNFRIIIFAAVLLLLIGYPVYTYIDASVHQGVKAHSGYLEVDLKSLGNFPFDEKAGTINDVPQKWRELDGKRVLLQGEVWAPNEAGNRMTRFELVYSIAKCCFGGPPKVQERVFAIVPDSMEVVNLTYQYAKVTGKLHVNARSEEGQVITLYTLEVEKVEPL